MEFAFVVPGAPVGRILCRRAVSGLVFKGIARGFIRGRFYIDQYHRNCGVFWGGISLFNFQKKQNHSGRLGMCFVYQWICASLFQHNFRLLFPRNNFRVVSLHPNGIFAAFPDNAAVDLETAPDRIIAWWIHPHHRSGRSPEYLIHVQIQNKGLTEKHTNPG